MNIGIPRERRPFEYRVGLTPAAVNMFASQGHACSVEHNAGLGAGFGDQDYEQAGARIVYSPHEVFGRADLLTKVARPLVDELEWLRPGTTLIGLLHLASARQDKIQLLLEKKITALAFEQIQLEDGSRPVLRPMSQIGGRMAAQVAAMLLQNNAGGKGILLGGIAGVPPAEIVIIGAGVVGMYAMQTFLGMGAHVSMLDTDLGALQTVHERCPSVATMVSTSLNLERVCRFADVLVGAVLMPGQRSPIVVTRPMVRAMKPRAIIMDISIDQGGCVETSRPTTHEHPTFIEEGVIHYCVPNIPGVVARTATYALVNAALPFVQKIATRGVEAALAEDPALVHAINTRGGEVYNLSRLTATQVGE
ncbi:MAG TPA: alanine dehydrogenase [Anaerolineales bacterium]|nr:alanine dehydrogenase [Anaerolineales bacterium]